MNENLAVIYSQLKREAVLDLVQKLVKDGSDPAQILEDLQRGMLTIMDCYEKREYSLSNVYEAIQIYKDVSQIVEPILPKDRRKYIAKVIIGTAQGDIHEVGKNAFAGMLECVGFEIIDLGADVSPEKCVETLKNTRAQILCISCIVSNGFEGMKKIVSGVKQSGLNPKILIGGG